MEDRDKEATYLKAELDRVHSQNKELVYKNKQLERSIEFNHRFNEMSAKLLAIEYIVKSSEYSIDRKVLGSILGITLSEKE